VRGLGTLLLLAAVVAAQDPEEKAKGLYDRYVELRAKDDYSRAKLNLLRQLGGLRTPTARTALLRILKATKSHDEKVVATLALCRNADEEAAREMLRYHAGRAQEAALTQALADGLATVTDRAVVACVVRDGLGAPQAHLAAACAEALAVLAAPEAAPRLRELYAKASGPAEVDVACAALHGLGGCGDAACRETILAAAQHADWRVRQAAADVLPTLAPDPAVLERINAMLVDPSSNVRRAVAAGCGAARLEAAVPGLVDLLEQAPRLRTRYVVAQALKAISGDRDYSLDAAAWREWWKHRGEGDIHARRMTFARYYGSDVFSDRVVFVVDASGSMSWPWSEREPKRITVARQQLARVLSHLDPGARFNVLVYESRVRAWQKGEAEATPANIERAQHWAERALADPDGDTHTYDALREALDHNPEFDTLYLLSDGNPSHGRYKSPEGIVAYVRAANRHRRAVLHTIALTLEHVDPGRIIEGERGRLGEIKGFMQELAAATGGTCQVVLRPPPDD